MAKTKIKELIQDYSKPLKVERCLNSIIMYNCKIKILDTWFDKVNLTVSTNLVADYIIIENTNKKSNNFFEIDVLKQEEFFEIRTTTIKNISAGSLQQTQITKVMSLETVAKNIVTFLTKQDLKCNAQEAVKTYHTIGNTELNKMSGKYLIMKRNGTAPTVYHDTRESVFNEYKRLKEKYPKDTFIISQII